MQWNRFDSPGSRLINAGQAKKENPKRFYRFSLIDPTDQPFATFKYYYRTQEKLEELGILGRQNDYDSSTLSRLLGTATECSISQEQKHENFDDIGEDDTSQSECEGDNGYSVPFPVLEAHVGHYDSPYERSITETPKHFYRLSIPPSLKLVPSAASSQPPCPKKLTPNAPMTSLVKLPSPKAEWLQRTPRPVKSVRTELQSTPLGNRKRTSSIAALRHVVTSALQRRDTSCPESTASSSSRSAF